MTIPDVNRLYKHWRTTPPLRSAVLAIASALGVNLKPQEQRPTINSPEEARRFFAATGGRMDGG